MLSRLSLPGEVRHSRKLGVWLKALLMCNGFCRAVEASRWCLAAATSGGWTLQCNCSNTQRVLFRCFDTTAYCSPESHNKAEVDRLTSAQAAGLTSTHHRFSKPSFALASCVLRIMRHVEVPLCAHRSLFAVNPRLALALRVTC